MRIPREVTTVGISGRIPEGNNVGIPEEVPEIKYFLDEYYEEFMEKELPEESKNNSLKKLLNNHKRNSQRDPGRILKRTPRCISEGTPG